MKGDARAVRLLRLKHRKQQGGRSCNVCSKNANLVVERMRRIKSEPRLALPLHYLLDKSRLVFQQRQPCRDLRLHMIQALHLARTLCSNQLVARLQRELRAASNISSDCSYLVVGQALQRGAERLMHAVALSQPRLHVHVREIVQVHHRADMRVRAQQDALVAHGAQAASTERFAYLRAVLACGLLVTRRMTHESLYI